MSLPRFRIYFSSKFNIIKLLNRFTIENFAFLISILLNIGKMISRLNEILLF